MTTKKSVWNFFSGFMVWLATVMMCTPPQSVAAVVQPPDSRAPIDDSITQEEVDGLNQLLHDIHSQYATPIEPAYEDIGDIDGDGVSEIVLRAPGVVTESNGYVVLYRGSDLSVWHTWRAQPWQRLFGIGVRLTQDVDFVRDGVPDMAILSAYYPGMETGNPNDYSASISVTIFSTTSSNPIYLLSMHQSQVLSDQVSVEEIAVNSVLFGDTNSTGNLECSDLFGIAEQYGAEALMDNAPAMSGDIDGSGIVDVEDMIIVAGLTCNVGPSEGGDSGGLAEWLGRIFNEIRSWLGSVSWWCAIRGLLQIVIMAGLASAAIACTLLAPPAVAGCIYALFFAQCHAIASLVRFANDCLSPRRNPEAVKSIQLIEQVCALLATVINPFQFLDELNRLIELYLEHCNEPVSPVIASETQIYFS